MKDYLVSKAIDAGTKLKVRSALNPILWLCGLISLPIMILMITTGKAETWMITLVFIPVVTAASGFIFLLIFDRDKLQSEEFQLQKRSLDIIQQKGEPAPHFVAPEAIIAIPKPNLLKSKEDPNG